MLTKLTILKRCFNMQLKDIEQKRENENELRECIKLIQNRFPVSFNSCFVYGFGSQPSVPEVQLPG